MPIIFHNADVNFRLPQKQLLKEFILKEARDKKHRTLNISFIFCSDEYLLDINKKFLHHDYYTDIITFPLVNDKQKLEAEVYISIDRVRENSDKFGQPTVGKKSLFIIEIQRVIFHGVLHLLGYKDKTPKEIVQMRKMEDEWLRKFSEISIDFLIVNKI